MTWDKAIALNVRDDTQVTGWIAPDGTFYGCDKRDHAALAKYVLGMEEREAEQEGYCKIFWDTADRNYGYWCKHLTAYQQDVLEQKGIKIKE